MKIKANSSLQAVLPTGPWANMRPTFGAELEMEIDEGTPIDAAVEGLQRRCYAICDRMVQEVAEKARIEKVKSAKKEFHWITLPSGKEVPSVTAIIDIGEDSFTVPPDELAQYASQSLICHAQVAHYIDTKKWAAPQDIKEIWGDIRVVKLGNLGLTLEGWDFPAFLEAYPIKDMKNGHTSYNERFEYGGTPDFHGIPVGWNKIKGFEHVREVPTLFDVKRTKALVKNMKQLAGYKNMKDYEPIEQTCIIELNDKNKCGYSKPEIIGPDKIEGYWLMFLRDRETFRKVYGI